MIIVGSRMYFRKNMVSGFGVCDHCGRYGKHKSYNGRRFGHIYFIPILPEAPPSRVLKECARCSVGMHVPVTEVPQMTRRLKDQARKAMAALADGTDVISEEGEDVSCTMLLAKSVELLHCLEEESFVEEMADTVQKCNKEQSHFMIKGKDHEFHGRDDQAIEAYKRAAAAAPESEFPQMALGSVFLRTKRPEEARRAYEQALGIAEEKLPVLSALLTVYETLRDHRSLAETYEKCFHLAPQLLQEKQFVKGYKKAGKKAGLPPSATG